MLETSFPVKTTSRVTLQKACFTKYVQQDQEQNGQGFGAHSLFSGASPEESAFWLSSYLQTLKQPPNRESPKHLPQPLQPQPFTRTTYCMVTMITKWCGCTVSAKKKIALNLYWNLGARITAILFSVSHDTEVWISQDTSFHGMGQKDASEQARKHAYNPVTMSLSPYTAVRSRIAMQGCLFVPH